MPLKKPDLSSVVPDELQRDVFKHYAMNLWIRNRLWLGALLMVFLVVAALFFIDWEGEKKKGSATVAETTADQRQSSAAAVLETKTGDRDKLDEFYRVSNAAPGKTPARYQRALALAKELDSSRDLTEIEKIRMRAVRVNILTKLTRTGRMLNLPEAAEFDSMLTEYLDELIELDATGESSLLTAKAHAGICEHMVECFLNEPTQENFDALKKRATIAIPMLQKKGLQLEELCSSLLKLGRDDSELQSQTFELLGELGDQFLSTGSEREKVLGSALHEQLIIRGRDINDLCFRAGIRDDQAIEELEKFLADVANSSDNSKRSSELLYQFAFKGIDALDEFGHTEVSTRAMNFLEPAIEKLEPESLKASAAKQLADYRKRSTEIVGTKIDFSQVEALASNVLPNEYLSGKPLVILFCDGSEKSNQEARSINAFRRATKDLYTVNYLFVAIDQNYRMQSWGILPDRVEKRLKAVDEFESLMAKKLAKTFLLKRSDAHIILAQIPVADAPYMVVLTGMMTLLFMRSCTTLSAPSSYRSGTRLAPVTFL